MQNIERKLESTFGKKNDLDSRLQLASSSVLTQRIDFQESSKPHSSITDTLKGKYVNLAPAPSTVVQVRQSPSSSDAVNTTMKSDGEGLPCPKVILFQEPLNFEWNYSQGTGFINCGNTCFLNAVLQCLIHTPPLTNYMMSSRHTVQCQMVNRERCILCNLEFLTKRSLTSSLEAISPKWFTNNLQYIGRHFRNGRQEDAHEFLRLSLEKMQKCALYGHNHLDKYSKETTVVNQIFGGFLRSQVQCMKCGHRSNTYDPLLDISLDIKTVNNLQQAFNQFVAADKLDAENAYKCERCKQKVTAFKRFTVHQPPNVLTIQLKRFQYGSGGFFGGGSKIHKPIQYPQRFNLRPFMSNKSGPPLVYTLIGSIQHEGYSCTSGHYVANVRCGDRWFNFNDSNGRLKNIHQILNEDSAYILFYMMEVNQKPPLGPELNPSIQNIAGVKAEDEKKQHHKKAHPHLLASSNSAATFSKPFQPVNSLVPHTSPKAPYVQTTPKTNGFPSKEIGEKVKSPLIPLSANRDKIRISIGGKPKTSATYKPLTQNTSVQTRLSSPAKSEKVTPRLVVKIKDGKSITIETSPDGERRILSDDDEVIAKMNEKNKKYTKKPSIVPYGDDSDSDWSSKEASPKLNTTEVKKEFFKENGQSKHGAECKHGVVLDRALNTTTSVPGNAHLFNTVALKDKVSHTHPQHHERQKDMKMFKSGSAPPSKREPSETLSCSTSPITAKHSGAGEWQTSVESVLSPSVVSNHSNGSNHSNSSTHDWSVLNGKTSTQHQERKHDGWTVTESRDSGQAKYVTEDKKHVCVTEMKKKENGTDNYSSPYRDVSDRVSLVKPEKPKDKNSEEYREYRRLKKMRKKHKRKHHEIDHNYSGVNLDTHSHSHKKKKKKHKKEKYRDCDEERHSKHRHDGNTEEWQHYRQRHSERDEESYHYKHRDDRHRLREDSRDDGHLKRKHEKDVEHESHKRHRKSLESSPEFEWVEKTVETGVPARTSISEPVSPCHRWDHHIKDGYKRKSTSGSSTPVVTVWDGLKHSTVVQELEKVSSYGYGAPVSGWDGHKSQLDAIRENNSRKGKDDVHDEEYDDEFDRGKVKKVKNKDYLEHRHNGNLFQQKQDQLNRAKMKWTTMKVGDNNPYKAGHLSSTPHSYHTKV